LATSYGGYIKWYQKEDQRKSKPLVVNSNKKNKHTHEGPNLVALIMAEILDQIRTHRIGIYSYKKKRLKRQRNIANLPIHPAAKVQMNLVQKKKKIKIKKNKK